MRIVVTGAAGHLGAAIVDEFSRGPRKHDVVALARADLDITDRAAVRARIEALAPDVIVNCAAYNDVDAAQGNPLPALEINAFGVIALASAAESAGAALVHFSTDFVFDGETDRPYIETDAPHPQSYYGCSKLLGEMFAGNASYVFRVESLFGGPTAGVTAREGSLGKMVRALKDGQRVPVFTDRTVSPAYAPDVAHAVRRALESAVPPGLYHCVNDGHASWETIALEASRLLCVAPLLTRITLGDVALAAPRPRFCALDVTKLSTAGVPMRPWRDALREWLGGR